MTQGIKDWSGDLVAGLDALTAAETQVLGLEPPQRRFRQVRRWLIAEDALRGDFADSRGLRQLLGTGGMGHWLVRSQARLSPAVVVRSQADAVLFKANLRSFYLDRHLSIKAANPGRPASRLRLNGEVAARRGFVASTHASAPKLRLDPGVVVDGFLAENMILAEPSGLAAAGAARLAEWLLDFYAANGLQPKPVDNSAVYRDAWLSLEAYAVPNGVVLSDGLRRRIAALLEEIGSTRRDMAVAVCNGDLSTTNLLFRGDHVYITDWEWLMRGPVFFDAVRLATQLNGFADAFISAVERRMPDGAPMFATRDQYFLACLLVAHQRIARKSDFTATLDEAAYARRLKPRIAKIVRLMENLRQ